MTTTVVDPLRLDLGGADLAELIDLVGLLTVKYDGRVSFLVDVDDAAEVELIALFKARGVHAIVVHPTGHVMVAAKRAGLAVPMSILSCRKED